MLTYFPFVNIMNGRVANSGLLLEKGNIIVFPQNEMEFLIVKLAGSALNSFELFSSFPLLT